MEPKTPFSADTVPLNNVCFDVVQEILQYGHAFDVEKVLSDERYQTLKVSKWKTRGLVAVTVTLGLITSHYVSSCSPVCLGWDRRRLRSGTAPGYGPSKTSWRTRASISTTCNKLVRRCLILIQVNPLVYMTGHLRFYSLEIPSAKLPPPPRPRGVNKSFEFICEIVLELYLI